jgi:hypothetical protein
MRNFLFLVAFMTLGLAGVQAQSCSKASEGKACCASKKSSATSSVSSTSEADMAAAADANIQKRTCEMSGTTTYFQKSVCSASGNVSWEEVKFDAETKKFTKVASASMEKDAVTGEKKEVKACCASKGAGAKACAGKEEGKKACAGQVDNQ